MDGRRERGQAESQGDWEGRHSNYFKKTIQSSPVGKFEREIQIVSMAPKRQYKGTRKMIDGHIGNNANLTIIPVAPNDPSYFNHEKTRKRISCKCLPA